MRRLVVNADDFGRSASTNAAVIQAHREGILTTATLMVSEPGFAEAVTLARENPRLGVGLHLTLVDGHSALPPDRVPGLVNEHGEFDHNPARCGWRYFFNRGLRAQLREEIAAQFGKFQCTGLALDHLDSHHHLHMHPVVMSLVLELAARHGVRHIRLTREPFNQGIRRAARPGLAQFAHACAHALLARRARPRMRQLGIRHTRAVFGLLRDGRIDEGYVLRLLPLLPEGDSELYSHPSLDQFRPELDALISPRVAALVDELGVDLIRYQDV
jgi:hopanoid biosynthesis associated protein HpnK